MASSAGPNFSSQPYTFTDSIDSQSFASIMATLSQNKPPMSISLTPEQSSVQASVSLQVASRPSNQGQTTATSSTLTTSTTVNQDSASSQASAASSVSGSSQSSSVATLAATNTVATNTVATNTAATNTAATNTAATNTAALATSSHAGSSATSTASSAASSTTNDLHQESSSGMSSPGMQAAVAVPIVVVVVALIALIFFCMRRRKRQNQNEDPMEKTSAMSDRKKKWSRHWRIFSFDTELLMGGRFSSTNSIRSRQTGSIRSTARSQRSATASEQSVDEVAPPYRDALAAGAGAGAATGVGRSASNATAPPPYLAPGRLGTPTSSHYARSTRSNRNPFADTPPISPIDVSPFNDPPGTSPAISRNSSLYRSVHDDASTIGDASDAASIREAHLARNASVMSGGRIINNVNRSPN